MAQPELHPGADLLSAFAEHALPEAERAPILAHMAGCARCREVVYLAQAAADAEPARAAAVETSARPGWVAVAFAKWRMALIPAAALATVGGVVLWVQTHPAPKLTHTAQVAAPSSPPSSPVTAGMAAPPPPSASPTPANPAHAVAPARPAPSAPRRAKTHSNSMDIALPGSTGAGALAFNSPAPAISSPMEAQRFHGSLHLDGRSAAMARYAPPPQPVRPPTLWTSRTPQGGPQWQQQQMADVAPDLNGQPETQPPQLPSLLPPPGQQPAPGALESAQVLQSSQQLERVTQARTGFALMELVRRAPLPSGLNAVSSAAMLNRLVVVDSGGSVFLSQDAGKHWETVAAQWSGKAIEVAAPQERRLMRAAVTAATPETTAPSASAPVSSASEQTAAPSPAPPLPPEADSIAALAGSNPIAKAGPLPPMLFTLVTDRHQTWVSADGKVWREPHIAVPRPATP